MVSRAVQFRFTLVLTLVYVVCNKWSRLLIIVLVCELVAVVAIAHHSG